LDIRQIKNEKGAPESIVLIKKFSLTQRTAINEKSIKMHLKMCTNAFPYIHK
jgi:hypothetical protein